jgi:hypothetical protein
MLRRRRAARDDGADHQARDPLAHVDPAAVSVRFAAPVADALDARRRYADVVAGVRDGPVRDRLTDAGTRLDAGVAAVWEIAQRATQVERTLAALDPDRVTDEYKRAKRSGADPELEEVLAQRFGSVQRLLNTLDDTDQRLRLLDARLGAAVAGAAEIALGGGGADRLGTELDGVVTELGALRAALDELG